uniref:MyTH4 domain-containing protein n=1 Tax=Leptobrachium leishanense TaxID=445787 RepID=A0A8C5R0W4_9ANUR
KNKAFIQRSHLFSFPALMRFMGDQQYREKDDVTCIYEILQLCKEKLMLKDEIYCQVLKQITENPKQESCNRGWMILSLLTGYFAPSSALLPYVTKYLQDIQGTYQGKVHILKFNLHFRAFNWRRESFSKGYPSPFLHFCHWLSDSWRSGLKTSQTLMTNLTVAADLVPEICEQLLVSDNNEMEEFAIFANKGKGEVVRPLRAGDYIHDFLLPDNSVTLEFKRVTWKAPLRGRSELYIQVLYSQVFSFFHETVTALPLFDHNVFQIKRISEESVSSPCFVAVNHAHLLILENNSQVYVCTIYIKSMRTMRPFDNNTFPGVELHYGSAEDPQAVWMELQEVRDFTSIWRIDSLRGYSESNF